MRPYHKLKNLAHVSALTLMLCWVSACSNYGSELDPTSSTLGQGSTEGSPSPTPSASPLFKIVDVELSSGNNNPSQTASPSPSTSTPGSSLTKVFFEPNETNQPINQVCRNPANSANSTVTTSCRCLYEWPEISTVEQNQRVTINRRAYGNITLVEPNAITCQTPDVVLSEVDNETAIRIRVISLPSDKLNLSAFSLTKSATETSSDFSSEDGLGFLNIHRYTCYEQSIKEREIKNKKQLFRATLSSPPTGVPNNLQKTALHAAQFCTTRSASGNNDCDHMSSPDFSAESYYFNLFIPSSRRGGIISRNQRFHCPRVLESLGTNQSVGSQGQFWPLDSSFAVARAASTQFSVPVEAPSVLGSTSQADTAPSICSAPQASPTPGDGTGSSSGGANNSISYKCLGWAAKPQADGTCGSIKDSQGRIRPMVRLRKFLALYPIQFTNTGKAANGAYAVDTVMVADRLVDSGDPLKPYTMHGPKPCNFAYFDRDGVNGTSGTGYTSITPTGNAPAYISSNSSSLNGKNIDGTKFPNIDSATTNSCSAMIPLIKYNSESEPTYVSLATSHSTNTSTVDLGNGTSIDLSEVYIRPRKAWAPHYEEDTAFQACVPESNPMMDPPLHFAKDAQGEITWCSGVYPTQNQAVDDLEIRPRSTSAPRPSPVGRVIPFTSPVVKASASTPCQATRPVETGDWTGKTSCTGGTTTLAGNTCGSSYPLHQGGSLCDAATHPSSSALWDCVQSSDNTIYTFQMDKTCDRTAINPGLGNWKHFPLQAPPGQIEDMMRADASYRCTLTSGPRAGRETPSTGCCDPNIVYMGRTSQFDRYNVAHFEPSANISSGMNLRTCGVPR